jgi:hypothetical protein
MNSVDLLVLVAVASNLFMFAIVIAQSYRIIKQDELIKMLVYKSQTRKELYEPVRAAESPDRCLLAPEPQISDT